MESVAEVKDVWEGRSVLVTRATGMVGSWLVKSLLAHGAHVVALAGKFRLIIEGGQVVAFPEKPRQTSAFISGGYFVFRSEFLEYLSNDDECVLEREPLERLAASRLQPQRLAVQGHVS